MVTILAGSAVTRMDGGICSGGAVGAAYRRPLNPIADVTGCVRCRHCTVAANLALLSGNAVGAVPALSISHFAAAVITSAPVDNQCLLASSPAAVSYQANQIGHR